MPDTDCEHCGATYHVRPSKAERSRFCSRECKDTFHSDPAETECKHCDITYEVKPSRSEETRFCSRECKDANKRERPRKTVTVNCTVCGTAVERIPYEAENNARYYCDTECKAKWMEGHWQGERHPNYRGGPNHEFGDNWLQSREAVRERDRNCRHCGEDGTNTHLDVHHIVPRRSFDRVERSNHPDNLVVLCRPCHNRAERGVIPCPHPHLGAPSTATQISAFHRTLDSLL